MLSLDALPDRCFRSLSGNAEVRRAAREPLASHHAYWAELLSGVPWRESGIVGFGTTEDGLPDTFLSKFALSDQVVVNCPFLEPKGARVWLGDGSIPAASLVSPHKLQMKKPFAQYQAVPFRSACLATSAPVVQSQLNLQNVFQNRLSCVRELLSQDKWRVALIRFNEFDLLNHLDVLESDRQSWCNDWFGKIHKITSGLHDTDIVAFSFFRHDKCRARINLNRLLESGSFCQQNFSRSESLRRRDIAVGVMEHAPMAVSSYNADTAGSAAYSPAAGVIQILNSERMASIGKFVQQSLVTVFGAAPYVVAHGSRLMIRIDGVEFSDEAFGPVFDFENKPASTHVNDGWFWFSDELDSSFRGQDEIAAYQVGRALLRARI